MWSQGIINGYSWCCKHYDLPSEEFGINGGCISKLMVMKDGKTVALYERGWCVKPEDDDVGGIVTLLIKKFN